MNGNGTVNKARIMAMVTEQVRVSEGLYGVCNDEVLTSTMRTADSKLRGAIRTTIQTGVQARQTQWMVHGRMEEIV
jgi:hypothetical protein